MATLPDQPINNRAFLDKWTKREQFCLVSAVSNNGEQNWNAVSRLVKSLCVNEARPNDWYSHKNCALQYDFLLETVENSNFVKRESVSSPHSSQVESPCKELLNRLADERIAELEIKIRCDQKEYAILCQEIKDLETGALKEEQLLEMLRQLESQKEQERIDEMKMENRMREREHRKQEMISSCRNTQVKRVISTTDTTTVDMDVEEPPIELKASVTTAAPPQQLATSPLLTSLLKTPSVSNLNVTCSNTSSSSSVRTTAPTITTLLTSGAIPNQPAITIRSNIPASETAFITRPISGPPVLETILPATKEGKSPSQSAPTLSMLLERNKSAASTNIISPTANVSQLAQKILKSDANNEEIAMDIEERQTCSPATSNEPVTVNSDEEQQLLEVFKNIGNIDDIDIDMSGVIDDEGVSFLDVSASPSTLKQDFEEKVDSKCDKNEKPEIENQVDLLDDKQSLDKNPIETRNVEKVELTSSDDSNDNIPLAEVASLESKERSQSAIEPSFLKDEDEEELTDATERNINEVDEENKCSSATSPKTSTTDLNQENEKLIKHGESVSITDIVLVEESLAEEPQKEMKSKGNDNPKPANDSDSSDVILIQTDDDDTVFDKPSLSDSNGAKTKKSALKTDGGVIEVESTQKNIDHDEIEAKILNDKSDTNDEESSSLKTIENFDENKPATPDAESNSSIHRNSIISIADTDEETSMSGVVSKVEAVDNKPAPQNVALKSSEATDLVKPEPNESITTITPPMTVLPVTTVVAPSRPMLRKLRDRDRSRSTESPIIEDETTTASDHSTKPNSRRRYSSTPVIDSIPNSPASSEHTDDRRETRGASKKIFLSIHSVLNESRNATIFKRAFHEEHAQKYTNLCLRPMDLPTIKRNIDSGIIRNIIELQRDVMLMCHNILILYKPNTMQHKTALAFLQDCHAIKEFAAHDFSSVKTSSNINGSSRGRGGSRKSQRLI